MIGTVKFYQHDKGFGFLKTNEEDVFFHISKCPIGYIPKLGDELEFTPVKAKKGHAAEGIQVYSEVQEEEPLKRH